MTSSVSRARAFSLVEVLLAILILALGLLGLGAIVPAVVKMQRTSTDQTLGIAAAHSARNYLKSRPEFNEGAVTGLSAWDHWLNDQTWSPGPPNPNSPATADHYLWQEWKPSGNTTMNFGTGNIEFTGPANQNKVGLVLADRLWPGATTQPMNLSISTKDPYKPQFVWDIVGRRVETVKYRAPQIQVALFVRRIDLNIRVPAGTNSQTNQPYTLRDVLTNPNDNTLPQTSDRCVPVAVTEVNDPTPTNRGENASGNPIYGNILRLDAWFDAQRADGKRDRIELTKASLSTNANADILFALASQPYQKLVDNFGNVYTVLRTDDELETATSVTVVVSPPVPANVPDPQNTSTPAAQRFRQVIFTPQIAAAAEVFTITRPVK